ncbi:MAG: ATP-binding protein [Clostridiales bacterium]|nr:ATP-binding protein [Clostridiales bacterium]
MVQRKEYLSRLAVWKGKPVIKVVTGVRRCGKSTLFYLYMDALRENGVDDNNILSLNLEDMGNKALLTAEALHEAIEGRLSKKGMNYIFIDEVQQCRDFERAIDSLHLKDNVDLYITGSNATLLSGDLATLLSGRYIEIEMLPLSFHEYLEFTSQTDAESEQQSNSALFADYMRFGSFPFVSALQKDRAVVDEYLDGLYNAVIVKDIVTRERVRDIGILEDVVKFLCSSIGSPISTKKVSDTLNSAGRKISVNTVEQYIRALTDSFIFYKADRFDIKGRQHLKTQNKYYIVDSGLRNMLLATSSPDTGHMLENIVYLELIRRGNKVNIGKVGDKEVDFVAESTTDGRGYYQVAATVLDESTLNRELESLMKINDHFPKYLLTLDEIGKDTYHNGIKQMNVVDWLLSRVSTNA